MEHAHFSQRDAGPATSKSYKIWFKNPVSRHLGFDESVHLWTLDRDSPAQLWEMLMFLIQCGIDCCCFDVNYLHNFVFKIIGLLQDGRVSIQGVPYCTNITNLWGCNGCECGIKKNVRALVWSDTNTKTV